MTRPFSLLDFLRRAAWLLPAGTCVLLITGCSVSSQQVTAPPSISPAGGIFSVSQQVTLSDTTPGAVIHYTTDGSAPTSTSPTYSAAFNITASTAVRAIATTPGFVDSRETAVQFNLAAVLQAAAPGISPLGGFFTTPQTATLTDSTPGAVIHYTVDGSKPTATSATYSGPISINSSTTLQALAVAPGYDNSDISTAVFNIGVPGSVTLSGSAQSAGSALAGATVQFYIAGNGGVGTASASIPSATAVTDTKGLFSVPVRCTAAADQVFVVVQGGTSVGQPTAPTGSLTLVSALGQCGTLPTAITVNDLTTVAAAYALAQFTPVSGTATTNIASSRTNTLGLQNAFLNASAIANVGTGKAGGANLPPTSKVPTAELATLASVHASCIAGAGAQPCGALLAAATPNGGTAPADSFTAMVRIARNPSSNVPAIFALAANGSYGGGLSAAPTDWSLALQHTGGGLNEPTALSVDGSGRVWVADYPGAVSEFSPQGRPLSPNAGYKGTNIHEVYGMTIDPSGNVWLANQESPGTNGGLGVVAKLSPEGVLLSGNGFGAGAVRFPEALAATASGNIWVVNYGNSTVAQLSPTGSALTPPGGLGVGSFAFPVAVAADDDGSATFGNQSDSTVTNVSASFVVAPPITCCSGASGVAIDAHGNRWISDFYGIGAHGTGAISEVSATGSVISAGYTGGGLSSPQAVAIDGAGRVWVVNYHPPANQSPSLTVLQGADDANPGQPISSSQGFGGSGNLIAPFGMAIDSAGSVWVANSGPYDASQNLYTITQFIGAAAPVRTPLIGRPVQP